MEDFEHIYQKKLNQENIEQLPEPPVRDQKLGRRQRTRRAPLDWPLMALTLIILSIGVIMVLSSNYVRAYYSGSNPMYLFLKQLVFAVIGTVLMLAASRIRIETYYKWSRHLYWISVILLVLVLVTGMVGGGSRRWLSLPVVGSMQPSEIAKVAVILYISALIYRTDIKKIKTFRYGVLPFLLVTGIVLALLVLEPHLSACIIIVAIVFVLMFVGGTRWRWFILAIAAVAVLALVAYHSFDYVQNRISAALHPEADPLDTGFQVVQSLLAVGSGGLTGLGLGQSRQKYLFLPEESNDYIFAIVCEELGFIGAALIIILFALMICRCYWIARHAGTKYGALVSVGIATHLAVQIILNIAVVTNTIPSTGISLPFFSYGGSALIVTMLEMGIILSVSRDVRAPSDVKREETA